MGVEFGDSAVNDGGVALGAVNAFAALGFGGLGDLAGLVDTGLEFLDFGA